MIINVIDVLRYEAFAVMANYYMMLCAITAALGFDGHFDTIMRLARMFAVMRVRI